MHPELFPAAFHNQDLSVTHIDALPPHRGAQYGQQQRGQAILPLVVTCFLHSFPQFNLAASTAAIAPVAATATTAPCPPAVTSLPIACCPAGPCPPALFPSHCLLCCRCHCASICSRTLPLLSPAVPLLLHAVATTCWRIAFAWLLVVQLHAAQIIVICIAYPNPKIMHFIRGSYLGSYNGMNACFTSHGTYSLTT